VLCAVLVGVWVASVWWQAVWVRSNGNGLIVRSGQLWIVRQRTAINGPQPPAGWVISAYRPRLRMWFETGPSLHYHYSETAVPLWIFPALLTIPTVIAWRLDTLARRRARLNHCPTCNYDRRGLPA